MFLGIGKIPPCWEKFRYNTVIFLICSLGNLSKIYLGKNDAYWVFKCFDFLKKTMLIEFLNVLISFFSFNHNHILSNWGSLPELWMWTFVDETRGEQWLVRRARKLKRDWGEVRVNEWIWFQPRGEFAWGEVRGSTRNTPWLSIFEFKIWLLNAGSLVFYRHRL